MFVPFLFIFIYIFVYIHRYLLRYSIKFENSCDKYLYRPLNSKNSCILTKLFYFWKWGLDFCRYQKASIDRSLLFILLLFIIII